MMNDYVLFPGTFDPITNGHLDIIRRGAAIFPGVLIAVAQSPSKNPLFSLQERVDLATAATAHLPNVRVLGFADLLANFIKTHPIKAILRGVRTVQDFEYELQLAALNRLLSDGVESVFLPPSEKWAFVSSTIVREIYRHNGEVSELVPNVVWHALQAKRNA